nr:clumping factor B-like [Setaria viridis]
MSKAAEISEDNIIEVTEADLKDDHRDEVAKDMEEFKKACLQSYSHQGSTTNSYSDSDFGFDRNSNSNSDGGYGSDHDLNSEFDGDSGSGYNSESDGDSRSDYNSESDGDSGSGYNFESDNNSGFNPNAESDGDSSFNSDSKSDSDSEFDYNSKVQLHRELADDYGRLANDFFDYVAGTPTTMVGLPTTPSTTGSSSPTATILRAR